MTQYESVSAVSEVSRRKLFIVDTVIADAPDRRPEVPVSAVGQTVPDITPVVTPSA
jgi:hypothetical protein